MITLTTAQMGRQALRFGPPTIVGLLTVTGTVRGWNWPEGVLAPLADVGQRVAAEVDDLAAAAAGGGGWLLVLVSGAALILASLPGRAPELRYRLALAILAADATAGAWVLGRDPGSWMALVVLGASLVLALVLAARWRRDPAPRPGPADATPWPWDLAAGLALALGALLAFAGIEREVGTNFYSHWQDWDALGRGEGLRSMLGVSTGTARTSMDSGPYRLLVHLAFATFGASWTTLRGLSAACLVLALAVAHALLRRRLSSPAAVGGVLLLATTPLLLDLGHVPSFLGPSVLLGVLTVAAYARWIDSDGARGGVVLGLLLWLDLYGFAPLRPLIVLLPLAAGWMLLRGRTTGRRVRPRILGPVGLALGIPLLVSLACTGGDLANLVYADGEFLPASGMASEDRFRVIDAPADAAFVPRSLVEILLASAGGWWPGANVDDGMVRPVTALHALAVILGLIALPIRGLWRGRSAALLTVLLAIQLPLLALVYPVALRRMAVWLPCLLLAAAGGLELVLGGRESEGGRRAWIAGGVLALMALLLVPSALGLIPRLARVPDEGGRAADPCAHQRSIADRALERGRELVWVQGSGAPGIPWSLCHPDVLGGNWGFYRWRECQDGVVRHTSANVGRWSGSGGPFDEIHVGRVGESAPAFAIGADDRLLFLDRGAGSPIEQTIHGTGTFWTCE